MWEFALILGGLVALQVPDISGFRHKDDFEAEIDYAITRYPNIPRSVLKGLIATESAFNPKAQAQSSTARGLTQVTRPTAEALGYNYDLLYVPVYSIDAGAKYLSQQIEKFGVYGGVRAYYEGPGNYYNAINGKRHNVTFHKDSGSYANKVFRYAMAFYLEGANNGTFT